MTSDPSSPMVIDGLQFARWSEEIFQQMRDGGVSAVHVTVAYHENFRDTVDRLIEWDQRFSRFGHLIAFAGSTDEIDDVVRSGRTAILFGLQNPSPIEADYGLVAVLYRLGIRFMQLSYNNQSLLCTGWMEKVDSGLTNFGREVVREMNRVGMIIDMSHSAERSTLDAIECSQRPIVVSHANLSPWRATGRNKSATMIKALAESGGFLGLSLYPGHLKDGPATTLADFAQMAAEVANLIGAENIGIGSDLCQDQTPQVLQWMREGRWKRPAISDADRPGFLSQPHWFRNNLDFPQLREGLLAVGFSGADVEGVLGRNWYRFLKEALKPAQAANLTGSQVNSPLPGTGTGP